MFLKKYCGPCIREDMYKVYFNCMLQCAWETVTSMRWWSEVQGSGGKEGRKQERYMHTVRRRSILGVTKINEAFFFFFFFRRRLVMWYCDDGLRHCRCRSVRRRRVDNDMFHALLNRCYVAWSTWSLCELETCREASLIHEPAHVYIFRAARGGA